MTWKFYSIITLSALTEANSARGQRTAIRSLSNLNIDQPLLNIVDALLTIRYPPNHQVEATTGEEVLVCGVVLPLAAEIPRPVIKRTVTGS